MYNKTNNNKVLVVLLRLIGFLQFVLWIDSVSCFVTATTTTTNNNGSSNNRYYDNNNIVGTGRRRKQQQQQQQYRSKPSSLSPSVAPLSNHYQYQQQQQTVSLSSSSSSSDTTIPTQPKIVDSTKGSSITISSTNKNNGKQIMYSLTANESFDTNNNNNNDNAAIMTKEKTNDNIVSNASTTSIQQQKIIEFYQNIRIFLRSTFLPVGYPITTPPGYLQYSIWSWIQDLTTQLRSVLATQRILEGIGVGRADATSLSALYNFLIRDAAGMVASLAFTSVTASQFKYNIKRWRIVADIMVDIGITMEIIAVTVPTRFFLPCICIGNICKAICGVAAGSVGGAINVFWSTGSDISDIQAKFGAQHTVTASIGLVAAAYFAKTVTSNIHSSTTFYFLYATLTILHIYANMKCMRLIAFPTVNTIRLQLLIQQFLHQWNNQSLSTTTTTTNTNTNDLIEIVSKKNETIQSINLPTPKEISNIEPLLFFTKGHVSQRTYLPRSKHNNIRNVPLLFGISYNEYQQRSYQTNEQLLNELSFVQNKDDDYYLISIGKKSSSKLVPSLHINRRAINNKIDPICCMVVLSTNSTPLTRIKAYFHATILRIQLEQQQDEELNDSTRLNITRSINSDENDATTIERLWDIFRIACTNAGWNLDTSNEVQTKGYSVSVTTTL